jgi:phosphoglycolate phosphatase
MKAIIFDLDGTLLDTIEDIADSMNHVLGKHGFPLHTIAEYKLFVGDGAANLVKRSVHGAKTANDTLFQLEKEYRAEYKKRQVSKTRPYDGIPELLSALTSHGIKKAVLSNKPHGSTEKVISYYFPGITFDAVIGQRSGHPIKPDPSSVLEILEILGVRNDEVLYVGDTGTDMLTARAAGLKAVGVLWGFREQAELAENGADLYANHPMELLEMGLLLG